MPYLKKVGYNFFILRDKIKFFDLEVEKLKESLIDFLNIKDSVVFVDMGQGLYSFNMRVKGITYDKSNHIDDTRDLDSNERDIFNLNFPLWRGNNIELLGDLNEIFLEIKSLRKFCNLALQNFFPELDKSFFLTNSIVLIPENNGTFYSYLIKFEKEYSWEFCERIIPSQCKRIYFSDGGIFDKENSLIFELGSKINYLLNKDI